MEKGTNDVNFQPFDPNELREYLLGRVDDEASVRRIEERLMVDEEFGEILTIAEDDLIEDYLDNSLSDTEKDKFVTHFLVSAERQDRVQLIKALKTFAAGQTVATEPIEVKPGFFDRFAAFLARPAWRYAVAGVVLIGIAILVWRTALYRSDVDTGLAELRQAFNGVRPFEARITDFDYAALNIRRGPGESSDADKLTRDRAERLLLLADQTPQSLAALGKFYLAERDYDKSISFFNKSAALGPLDANRESDLGTALLEAGKKISEENAAKSLELIDQSLGHFANSIKLDPKLGEPRFNRALALEAVPLREQAIQAWREYLELDSNSGWANEAREHLKQLESATPQERSAVDLENDFVTAVADGRTGDADLLISGNREIIKQKYLPQRLAMSLAEAHPDERDGLLQSLSFAGESESRRIGDEFAKDLAVFYSRASEAQMVALKEAQRLMQQGYSECLNGDFSNALTTFESARSNFQKGGNDIESRLSDFLIVYCLMNTDQIVKGRDLAKDLADLCEQRRYRWLKANALYWLAEAQTVTGQKAAAVRTFSKALDAAEQAQDPAASQKVLISLARQRSFVGQYGAALNYLFRAIKDADAQRGGQRQRWRNFSDGGEVLIAVGYKNLAREFALENVKLAADLNDDLFGIYSAIDAGIAHASLAEYEQGRNWFLRARESAAAIADDKERKHLEAKSLLELGHVERKLSSPDAAARFYDEAFALVNGDETPYYFYEIQKGRLLARQLSNSVDIETQLTETLKTAEKYRDQIFDEKERTSFFDREQSIYDIAVDNAFSKGRYAEAYDYAELSSARSLLEWMRKGIDPRAGPASIDKALDRNSKPLSLQELRERLPPNLQIVQFSVLNAKTLVWIISKDVFRVSSVEVSAEDLKSRVREYVRLISSNDDHAGEEHLSRELYRLLLADAVAALDEDSDICIVPDKVLFHLPFGALRSADGKPFLSDFRVVYAPSSNVFLLCTEEAQRKSVSAGESILAVGNPTFDKKMFPDLPDLNDAETEAATIANNYSPRKVLLGKAATKNELRDAIPKADVLHFAGHYLVRHGSPLESGLVMAGNERDGGDGGYLTNSELISQRFDHTRLVVLSACQTGVEQYFNGEGLAGLSRTFVAAGVPVVVASQWPVDSAATSVLMQKFHAYRTQNISTAESLRRAQTDMMQTPGGKYTSPYFWASFAVFGGFSTY